MQRTFEIHAMWDEEARVWFVSESDVPGLATEAPTVDDLISKLRIMVPEMLELNGMIGTEHDRIPFSVKTDIEASASYC